MKARLNDQLRTRKKLLDYYLKSAKTPLAIAYWSARLDELDRVRRFVGRL
jgi:hypothetical protein